MVALVPNTWADLVAAQKTRQNILPEGSTREWIPCSRGQVRLGCWVKFKNNTNRTYWCTFWGGRFATLQQDEGLVYTDPFDLLWSYLKQVKYSYVQANNGHYACGDAESEKEKAGLQATLESVIESAVALNNDEFPQIDIDYDLVKSGKYTRNGKPRVKNEAMIINYDFVVERYFTREDTDIQARNFLKKYGFRKTKNDSSAVEKIAKLLGTVVPKTASEIKNFNELLARKIGEDWWESLKTLKTIPKTDVWVRLLKREKGI